MSGFWKPRFSPDGTRVTHEDGATQQWENQWLDNLREIYQNGTHLVIDGVETEFPAGSVVAAGGGKWAAFVQRAPFTTYLSWAPLQTGCGNPAINQRGEYAYTDNFAGESKTLFFRNSAIDTGAITDVRVSNQALVWTKAARTCGLWLDGNAEVASDIQVVVQEFRPVPVDSPDGPWVLNHTPTGLIVRPLGEQMGYRFDNGGECYYPDGFISGHMLHAIFTNHQGVLDKHDFDLTAPRVDLTVPLEEPVHQVVGPLWFGFFDGGPDAPEHWRTTTPPQSLPGNCYLNVADGIVYTMDGRQVAQYVAAEQPGQKINEEVAKARLRHPSLPVIPYWTRKDHQGPVPDGDWIGVEAYQLVNESNEAFVARIVAAAARCKKVAFIPQCFSSNIDNTPDLRKIPASIAQALIACKNGVAAFPFSGTGRASGLWQHPEAVPAWHAFGASLTRPEIVLIDQPTQPQEPHVPDNRPTPEQWINHEFPQLIAAYRANPTNAQIMQEVPGAPFAEWGAFQGMRRFGPEARSATNPTGWTFETMLADVAKEAP